ncbi:hypothetical protein QC762_0061480 [Podospora pseudocomata]|uniref:Uncharacterized protein n=1 Tax=Podospora pseudocomata TaxID=2093779 RepID=A0ABR0GEA0_9PEZI|nr:hypothetical protein QC762_0061480 [Podospora pseudocomata]
MHCVQRNNTDRKHSANNYQAAWVWQLQSSPLRAKSSSFFLSNLSKIDCGTGPPDHVIIRPIT